MTPQEQKKMDDLEAALIAVNAALQQAHGDIQRLQGIGRNVKVVLNELKRGGKWMPMWDSILDAVNEHY